VNNLVPNKEGKDKDKQASISRIPLLIPPQPSKSVLAKSKFFKGSQKSNLNKQSNKPSYAQASKNNIQNFLKNVFPKSVDKISEIHNIMSKSNQKGKSKLNMTTKGPSRK